MPRALDGGPVRASPAAELGRQMAVRWKTCVICQHVRRDPSKGQAFGSRVVEARTGHCSYHSESAATVNGRARIWPAQRIGRSA